MKKDLISIKETKGDGEEMNEQFKVAADGAEKRFKMNGIERIYYRRQGRSCCKTIWLFTEFRYAFITVIILLDYIN